MNSKHTNAFSPVTILNYKHLCSESIQGGPEITERSIQWIFRALL